jgi:hypothetical protein
MGAGEVPQTLDADPRRGPPPSSMPRAIVGCEFCIDIGSEFARRSGLSDEQMLSLHDDVGPEGFSEGKTCALRYTAATGIDSMSITNRNLTSPASMRS